MIKLWTDESRHFVPGVFPNVCDTGGDCSNVWHYTQVVSYLSTDLGCGYAPGGGFNWLVCRYNPGGNKDGKPVIADVNSTIRARQIGGDYTGTFGPPPDNDDVNSVAFYDPNFPGFDEPINDSGDTKVEPSLPSNYVDTLVEPPTLTQAEIFRPLSQWEIRNRDYGAIMMMYASGNPYQRAYSQFTFARVLFYAGERSCSLATMMVGRAQAQAALAALKKIQSELPEGGDMAIVDAEELKGTIDDFESLMGQSNSCPTDSSTAGSDTAASDTSVEQPELPTGEVFDPDPPKKPADVM